MDHHDLPLDQLRAHPANSNVMPPPLLAKLKHHLATTGRYPPVIVRPHEGAYQVLDGHHRLIALRELGHATARCVVWDVDDDQALLLLATLNRLQGQDDPRRRAALVAGLRRRLDVRSLVAKLPEDGERLRRLLSLAEAMPTPRPPRPIDDLPVAVHFFMLPAQRDRLESSLRSLGGTRDGALLRLLDTHPLLPGGHHAR